MSANSYSSRRCHLDSFPFTLWSF
uniref:Uncharacterized protein n=1 Tax=Anguilla anguilla TaxID=7936 RepID=A0A0E9TAS5_ANGAN